MDAPPFVHLHCHSHYSLLDGAGSIKGLLERAATLRMNALALTDHGNLHGALKFFQQAKEIGIKPILGWTLLHSLWRFIAIGLCLLATLTFFRRRSANLCYLITCEMLVVRRSLTAELGAIAGLSSSAENTVGQANRGTRQFRCVGLLAAMLTSVMLILYSLPGSADTLVPVDSVNARPVSAAAPPPSPIIGESSSPKELSEVVAADQRTQKDTPHTDKSFNEVGMTVPPETDQEAQHRPWIVTGEVTDTQRKPIEGAVVRARCGMGTLRQTGQTTTDAQGKYLLRFGPGWQKGKIGPEGVSLQTAAISVSKPGYYEPSLGYGGRLTMIGEVPPMGNAGKTWSDKIILPNWPYCLNFMMKPAAVVDGRLTDDIDHPLAEREVSVLSGWSPNTVLTSIKTDAQGRFKMDGLPTREPLCFACAGLMTKVRTPFYDGNRNPIVLRFSPAAAGGKPALSYQWQWEKAPDEPLKVIAQSLAPILEKLHPKATVEYRTLGGKSLTITYLPQTFKIHGEFPKGFGYAKEARDEVGPSAEGFILKVYIQFRGEVGQLVVPLTIQEPYWKTLINVTPLGKTDKQISWGLSYGSHMDEKLLDQIRAKLNSF
jgi:hypothetical protein